MQAGSQMQSGGQMQAGSPMQAGSGQLQSSSSQMQSGSNLIHKKGERDLYSKLDELNETDKCSFMAAKFEECRIPLLPPPKECC